MFVLNPLLSFVNIILILGVVNTKVFYSFFFFEKDDQIRYTLNESNQF